MQEENYNRDSQEEIFSKRVRAGKRTYFFDVKATRNNDYYITITESKRSKFDDGNFIKMKIHLYKEDFNKFSDGLAETIGHVKTTLLPEYNFDEYDRQDDDLA
ncbi:MAG: DNA-binding protein [Flavobacteriales bacterium]|nr:MAG: DNA-binding protein [Flavobacteriales bacterium]